MTDQQQHKFECECRHWITLVERHGRAWWADMQQQIRQRRGQAELDRLIAGIKQQRNNRSKSK